MVGEVQAEEGLFIRGLVGYPKLPLIIDNWRNSPFGKNPCLINQGRAFNISINNPLSFEAVNLSGLSVMIFSSRRLADEDWGLFHLTLLPGSADSFLDNNLAKRVAEGNSGAVTDVSLFPNYKSTYIGTYDYTYEILFHFPPVFVKKGQTYTALFECRTNQGFLSVWESSRLSPIGKAHLFDGSFVKPYLSDTGIQHSLYGVRSLLYHPVILVHDFGGRPQDFEDNGYAALLSGESFNPKYVKFFDFGSDGPVYRSSADIKKTLTPKFTDDLNVLSADYIKEGGDGKVDVVAFGLSNLLVKDYLSKNKSQSKVRSFISVGALNKGSWLVDMDRNGDNFNPGSSKFNSKIASLFLPDLKKMNVISSGRDSGSFSSFLDQGRSDSPIVLDLSDSGKIPSREEIHYYNIMGDILVSVKQSLLGRALTSQNSLGDGSVLTDSARILCDSGDTSCSTTFTESSEVTRTLKREDSSLTYSTAMPDISSFKFLHHKLISSSEVKNKIKEILTAF